MNGRNSEICLKIIKRMNVNKQEIFSKNKIQLNKKTVTLNNIKEIGLMAEFVTSKLLIMRRDLQEQLVPEVLIDGCDLIDLLSDQKATNLLLLITNYMLKGMDIERET